VRSPAGTCAGVSDSVIDNAIPIEGWINDPTDHDLLHLLPMLEGLQYVTDVRAFLALRGGEDGKHTMVS
jgi:CTD nuclear envelope phosphatase 1